MSNRLKNKVLKSEAAAKWQGAGVLNSHLIVLGYHVRRSLAAGGGAECALSVYVPLFLTSLVPVSPALQRMVSYWHGGGCTKQSFFPTGQSDEWRLSRRFPPGDGARRC